MEVPEWMSRLTHRTVQSNGMNMHVVEQGTGPTLLLLHGFPEFWYSWRYQIPALAAAGFHVVAPDLRGCGQTDAPHAPDQYTAMHLVGDVVGLLDALGVQRVLLVGHDWGATVAWDLCLFRPDLVAAVVCLSVPFRLSPPTGRLVDGLRQALGQGFYICRFQEPGRAERDFERTGTRVSLEKILYSGVRDIVLAPEDKEWMEAYPGPPTQPPWITDFDIQFYAADKEKSGWTGGLNYYRCLDKSQELRAPWAGARLSTKALFIIGREDLTLKFPGTREYLDKHFRTFVPNLKEVVYLDGGHFIQQEQPAQVTRLLLDFFAEQTTA